MIQHVNTSTLSTTAPAWHAAFISMLPSIRRNARRAFRHLPVDEREEAIQAVMAYAALAYAALVRKGKAVLGRATPLARFGAKQFRSGRLIGGVVNSLDVGSRRCQLRGCRLEPLNDWKEALCDCRRATPADIAALRIDFNAWFETLSPRNQRLTAALALGEQTSSVAQMFRLSAGRVSQLRHELYDSWHQFIGEPILAGN